MKNWSPLIFVAGLSAALVVTVPVSTQGPLDAHRATVIIDGREAVSGEVLVKFRDAQTAENRILLEQQVSTDENEEVGGIGVRRLHSSVHGVEALLTLLRIDPRVEYAEPNYVVHASATPNDTQFLSLWGLLNTGQSVSGVFGPGTPGVDIGAVSAWDRSTGSRANVVAVIDTGIDYTHPDLAANMWSAPTAFTVTIGGQTIMCAAGTHGFNAIAKTCDPMDDHNHGTHVAGTIGAVGNNNLGTAGVNWTASIMGAKFLDAGGTGSTADVIDAIEFVIQAKAAFNGTNGANVRVLSNSWGGGSFSQALLDEINKANTNDMLFVAAAGNGDAQGIGQDDDVTPHYPASYNAPNVIAVAATDNTDHLASFSNYGLTSVHLAAPGVGVLSTTLNNTYMYSSGTSMATPHVSGAAALVLSTCAVTTAALKSALLNSVNPVAALAGRTTTGGRLNVNNAIQSCLATVVPAGITSPNPGATLSGSSTTFTWTSGTGVTQIWLDVGTSPGGSQIYSRSQGLSLTTTVSGLPTDGSTVHVRLWSLTAADWRSTDYTYTASTPGPAAVTSPSPGTTLPATSVTFSWTSGTGVTQIWLDVGTTPGGSQIYAGSQGVALSRTVAGLPANSAWVYVRLWSLASGGWSFFDYTYTAAAPVPSAMLSPIPGTVLPGATATFSWSAGVGVTQIWLDVGRTVGGSQIYSGPQGLSLSRAVSALPTNGSTVRVRLWSLASAGWSSTDYSYTAATMVVVASGIVSPTPNTTLSGTSVTFSWTAGVAVTQIWLDVGTTLGGNQIYAGSQGTSLLRTVTGLPANSAPVYVRLWSLSAGSWTFTDYTYTATSGVAAALTGPSSFVGTSATFTWTSGTGVTAIWLDVGTTFGGSQIYGGAQTSLSRTVTGIPATGNVYVRLWSLLNGQWVAYDYIYS